MRHFYRKAVAAYWFKMLVFRLHFCLFSIINTKQEGVNKKMSKAARLSSREIHKKLAELGVDTHISGAKLDYQNDIFEAVKLLMSKFPEFYTNGLIIREAYFWELTPEDETVKGWISYAKPVYRHGKLMTVVLLNPVWFRSKKLKHKLKEKFVAGKITYSDVIGNICHELGHVLWFELLAMNLSFKLNNKIRQSLHRDFVNDYNNLHLVSEFCAISCSTVNITYKSAQFVKSLSEYASDNAAEAFAESVAEYCTSSNVRPLANEIIRQYFLNYNQYKKNTD